MPRSSQRARTTFCWLPPESVAIALQRVVARADRELARASGGRRAPRPGARSGSAERREPAPRRRRRRSPPPGRTGRIASRLRSAGTKPTPRAIEAAGPSAERRLPPISDRRRSRACAGRRPPRRPPPTRSRASRRARRSRPGRPRASTSANARSHEAPPSSSITGSAPSSQVRVGRPHDAGGRAADHRLDERPPVEVLRLALRRRPSRRAAPARGPRSRAPRRGGA